TLLLDEINSLSMILQAKLLRVLQEKTIRRIGDTEDKAIDVRIIATMNEDPIEAIAKERMRKDLYYRLGVVTLFIPFF
ncbi:sigma 54-interacting transcriptional regulator, partial [Staphylococcus sp. SIMBA_130]